MTPLRPGKRLIKLAKARDLVAGFALVTVAEGGVTAIPIGLTLLLLAFAAARRGMGRACSRLCGRNTLLPREAV